MYPGLHTALVRDSTIYENLTYYLTAQQVGGFTCSRADIAKRVRDGVDNQQADWLAWRGSQKWL